MTNNTTKPETKKSRCAGCGGTIMRRPRTIGGKTFHSACADARKCTSCGALLDADNYARGNVCESCREP